MSSRVVVLGVGKGVLFREVSSIQGCLYTTVQCTQGGVISGVEQQGLTHSSQTVETEEKKVVGS